MSDGHDHECIEITVTRGLVGRREHISPVILDSAQDPATIVWQTIEDIRADVKARHSAQFAEALQAARRRRAIEAAKKPLTPGFDGAMI